MDGSLTWQETAAEDLSPAELYAALRLRAEIFVLEQDCPYVDPDGADLQPGVRHLFGWDEQGGLAAYARVLPPDERHDVPRVGRVVVAEPARGRQTGRRLMEQAIEVCERHWPGEASELGGQAHLRGFYESLGYVAVGEVYVEDGIPHQWMRRG